MNLLYRVVKTAYYDPIHHISVPIWVRITKIENNLISGKIVRYAPSDLIHEGDMITFTANEIQESQETL